jgi:hypothetical protein
MCSPLAHYICLSTLYYKVRGIIVTKIAYLVVSDAAGDAVLPLARRCSYTRRKQLPGIFRIAECLVKRFSKPPHAAGRRSGALGWAAISTILRSGMTYRQPAGRGA